MYNCSMNIYISGISGTGMGPLALMAKAAGYTVWGSDLARGAVYDELVKAGVEVYIGEQDGGFLRDKLEKGVDWFVYTSALTEEHAELKMARAAGVKCSKRDDLTVYLVDELRLKMVAVAGTHGKTTTTAMLIWGALKLGLPVAHIVGTTLGYAPAGAYHPGDKYFIYEADEYDRNFLKYHPWLAVIPAVSYDHPDIYPTKEDYEAAFSQFEAQSRKVIKEVDVDAGLKLAGEVRRYDASLAMAALTEIMDDNLDATGVKTQASAYVYPELLKIMNEFPGVGRRFERLRDGLYTDYAHHPEEIAATVGIAREQAEMSGKKGVVVIYQPHQNTRQHEVRGGYREAFVGVDKVLWLPTYLTREEPGLEVLSPDELISDLRNAEVAEPAELGDILIDKIKRYLTDGYLVVLMTAGPADEWLRKSLRFIK